jgi:hypothetical protein
MDGVGGIGDCSRRGTGGCPRSRLAPLSSRDYPGRPTKRDVSVTWVTSNTLTPTMSSLPIRNGAIDEDPLNIADWGRCRW